MKQQPFIPAMANMVSEGRFKSEDVCFQYFAQQFLNVQDFKLTNNKKENKTEVATTKYMDYTSGLCVSNKHNKLYRLEGRLSVKCVYKSMYVDLFVKCVIKKTTE